MPDNPNQLRDPATGRYGHAIYQRGRVNITTDEVQQISDLAKIARNAYVANSMVADAYIGNEAKVVSSKVGNDTRVGDRTFVFGSDLAEANEIGADSSIVSSQLDSNRGHIEIFDHVSITASQIGQSVFVQEYTSIQNSTIGMLCELAGHSLILNSSVGDDSHFGELCDIQGAIIYGERRKTPSVRAGMDRRILSWISPYWLRLSDPQPII